MVNHESMFISRSRLYGCFYMHQIQQKLFTFEAQLMRKWRFNSEWYTTICLLDFFVEIENKEAPLSRQCQYISSNNQLFEHSSNRINGSSPVQLWFSSKRLVFVPERPCFEDGSRRMEKILGQVVRKNAKI